MQRQLFPPFKRVTKWLILVTVFLVLSVGPVVAFFTYRLRIVNNTFASGSVELRFFYDCQSPGNLTDIIEITYGGSDPGVVIDCPPSGDGSDEAAVPPTREALLYTQEDGATVGKLTASDIYNLERDWTTANGWWTAASSVLDHTLLGPSSVSSSPNPKTDWVSIGNAGDYPVKLKLQLASEQIEENERVLDQLIEPLDGIFSHPHGGDKVDPASDSEWSQVKKYDIQLAEKIQLTVERIDALGHTIPGSTHTLKLSEAFQQPLELGNLSPDEVGYVQFIWQWISDETDNEYQNMFFDFALDFQAETG